MNAKNTESAIFNFGKHGFVIFAFLILTQ